MRRDIIFINQNSVSSIAIPENHEGILGVSQVESGGGCIGWDIVRGDPHKEKEEFVIPKKRIAIHCVLEQWTIGRSHRGERRGEGETSNRNSCCWKIREGRFG